MFDWDKFDEEAANEGKALRRAFRSQRPRKPHGVDRRDVKRELEKEDILRKLNVIGGKPCL